MRIIDATVILAEVTVGSKALREDLCRHQGGWCKPVRSSVVGDEAREPAGLSIMVGHCKLVEARALGFTLHKTGTSGSSKQREHTV